MSELTYLAWRYQNSSSILDYDDLIQEGQIALWLAKQKRSTCRPYIIILRAIHAALKSTDREYRISKRPGKKSQRLFYFKQEEYLDEQIYGDENENIPYETFARQEKLEKIPEVLIQHGFGYSYKEISGPLGVSSRLAKDRCSKIRQKLRNG